MFLRDFHVIRPPFEAKQRTLLDWMLHAHGRARMHLEGWKEEGSQLQVFKEDLSEKLLKIGLGENKIHRRAFQFDDCYHQNWQEMKIFNVDSSPEGYHLKDRMALYDQTTSGVFEAFYPENVDLPKHLIHATCTGYIAPSPGQRLVSKKGGGTTTTITNAYHMGCYGAIPSIRMAMGHFAVEQEASDIVHTELCSLHFNPTLHSLEQLVVQSLFADGSIKYRLSGRADGPCLKILAIKENLIPDSTSKMSWLPQNWGFAMTISKEIPVLIRRHLPGYLDELARKAGPFDCKRARFAIHPGGPKIIEQISQSLGLEEWQIQHSKKILQTCGNMSSATLPHIWNEMLQDNELQSGEPIVSLAFGPGLTICGGLFEKR